MKEDITTTNESHNCSKVIAKVVLSLDGFLSNREEEELLKEVAKCPNCLEKYNIEKYFKEFLLTKVTRKKVPATLVTMIRERIRSIATD